MPAIQEMDDTLMDVRISVLLRTGMILSATIIFIGGALFHLHHGHSIPNYRVFRGVPASLNNVSGIVQQALHGHDLGIIQFGLLLLIATPVARVLFSVISFWMERDYLYVAISGIVLVVLLYSLFVHRA